MLARRLMIYRQPHSLLHHYRSFTNITTTKNDNNTTSIRLYRILLRMINGLNDDFPLQNPLDPRDYGQARLIRSNNTTSSNDTTTQLYNMFYAWNDDNSIINTWYLNVCNVPYDEEAGDTSETCSSLFCSKRDIQHAIQQAFRRACNGNDSSSLTLQMQRLAMNAIQNVQEQKQLQSYSSVSIDSENRVRVVATSSCIGSSWTGSEEGIKYRFAYRIRVENLPSHSDTVQLLGRSWHIQDTLASGEPVGEAQHVHAPTTGAVGHLPVLQPGDTFEYMSGCELFTQHGTMSGAFFMAIVVSKTKSAMVGDAVKAFAAKNNPNVFSVPVHEFALAASDE